MLVEQFLHAANISRTKALETKPKDCNDVVPFVVTYNPALPRISNILRKHFNILHSSNRCKDVFKQPPFVAYRRSSNLRDLLVKAQLPVISNNHFPPGSFRCGQNCATCPYITNGLTRYTFYATGETRSITSHITCNTKNVIYMVQCNHSHNDMQLIPPEKIHSSRDSVRKARESHLIDKAMTLEPHGLNRRDELL